MENNNQFNSFHFYGMTITFKEECRYDEDDAESLCFCIKESLEELDEYSDLNKPDDLREFIEADAVSNSAGYLRFSESVEWLLYLRASRFGFAKFQAVLDTPIAGIKQIEYYDSVVYLFTASCFIDISILQTDFISRAPNNNALYKTSDKILRSVMLGDHNAEILYDVSEIRDPKAKDWLTEAKKFVVEELPGLEFNFPDFEINI